MYTKPKTYRYPVLFNTLSDQLNPTHALYLLLHKVDWQFFNDDFSPLYCSNNGRPCKAIRLMYGLLILKHVSNLSGELLVEQ